jgi:hypothetical protein
MRLEREAELYSPASNKINLLVGSIRVIANTRNLTGSCPSHPPTEHGL